MFKLLKKIHFSMLFSMLGLSVLGVLFIFSASFDKPGFFELKQCVWVAAGLVAYFMVAAMGYRSFLGMSYLFYAFTLLLLVLVHFLGTTVNGARLWFSIGPIAIQPSEFAKVATLLAMVKFIGNYQPGMGQARPVWGTVAIATVPFLIILKQPDLGSALIFLPMLFTVLFLWGIRIRYLIMSMLIGLVSMPIVWNFLKAYQKKRLLVFLDPSLDPLGAGYTAIQSKIAVGSGGLLGKGFLLGTQTQLNFVPEHHTDFIFSVIAEEWGFIGSLALICLYVLLFISLFRICDHTTDPKAKMLVSGIAALIFSQVFINIGMTFGWMPITGLTLPLVSYGGSSFVLICFALALALSVHRERSIF
ncbi:MAG TPA: rod shape-determining protein RodA [Candidatus Omnitrophica bacterium]|nr:rod shape-determining protein RodA [Candidatus Omnitrophota bacterium]